VPINLPKTIATIILTIGVLSTDMNSVSAQTPPLPREIRGYKVERSTVEVKKLQKARNQTAEPEDNELIQFGDPKLVKATPLGISLEIPIVVSPVTQKGVIDFLTFEEMEVNGTSVSIEDYQHKFELPDKRPITLKRPLSVYINLPNAVLAAVGEWTDSKETWPITGRVYIFGRFKKALFNFKRCIPIQLNLTITNPMRNL
jgi:hypothetical protein